jgi:hypothetical protein
MTAKVPQMVGDSYADILVWTWDRSRMHYETKHEGTILRVLFHKIGGRWSKTLPNGKPNPSDRRSYWTISIQPHDTYPERPIDRYDSAEAAKEAVAEMYRKYLRGHAALYQGRS